MSFARRPSVPVTAPRARVTDLTDTPTRAEIFARVLTSGPMSRTALATQLELSPSTVTRVLTPLIEEGYLRETPPEETTLGRPKRLLHVNTERHLAIGIKIAPTHVAAVLTDMAAQVLARAVRPIADHTPPTALGAAAELVAELTGQVPGAAERMLGLGVGVSGHVDSRVGLCRYSALLDWRHVDVAGPLVAATGLPVAVNNDVNALVVAEQWFGEGRDVNDFAVVTVGPGVGCGLLLGGTLYAGANGMAGEFGHLPLDPDGPVCSCGARGCLESLASSGAVLRHLREHGGGQCADIDAAMELARRAPATGADPAEDEAAQAARDAFAAAGEALGRGLAGLLNLLNLEKVILAGEGVAAHDLFGPAMTAALERHAFSSAARECILQVDPVTDDLWARGAACLVIQATLT
ncbi:ROK family protein [Streptacidiphilus sp. MAP5-3]|uniref:ROK family protein n=1 Tax=unclassified Streptacidiphilus TaxID=2643834 RepID=UPI0035176C27